jgi:hypothetical protein
MYHETVRPLTFESLLRDPLTRLLMDADGVSVDELAKVLWAACDGMRAREDLSVMRAAPERAAVACCA